VPIYRHLLAHDADRCLVAEVDGQVVGFTAAFVRGAVWCLAALLIAPPFQGRHPPSPSQREIETWGRLTFAATFAA